MNKILVKENKSGEQKNKTHQNLKEELNERAKLEQEKLKLAKEKLKYIKEEEKKKVRDIIKKQFDKDMDLKAIHDNLKIELQQKSELSKLRKEDQLDNYLREVKNKQRNQNKILMKHNELNKKIMHRKINQEIMQELSIKHANDLNN